MATKKAITEEQLRAANKAGYSTQQIAQEVNKFEKRTGNDAVFGATYKGPAEGTVENNAIAQGKPIQQAVQAQTMQPIIQQANPNMIDTSTGKPVSESPENAQYNILPENVTGVKVSPTLQAKIDAKKNGTPAVVPTEIAPVENKPVETVVPTEEVKTETVTTPTEVKTEVTDIEKNAQATGVAYTMQNGQATYNPKTTEEAAKILAMGGKLAGETKMTAVAQASLNKVRGLGQMTDQQLANNIAGGQVSNKELELLNTMNPQLVAQAKELSKKKIITNTTNEIQADNSAIIKGEEPIGMSKPLQDLVNKLADIDADTKSPAEMKTAYQDSHPEMIQSRDAINTLNTRKREAILAKMRLYDETRAKFSGYPESAIIATYSTLARSLDDSIYMINDQLNTEISNYNMYLDDMNAEIDFEIGQQGKQEERLFQMYGVTRAEEIREEDIIRKDQELKMAMEQAQSEAEYNQYKDERDFNFKIVQEKQKAGQWEAEYDLKTQQWKAEYGLKSADYNLKLQQAQIDSQKGNWSVKDGQLINADTGEMKPMQSFVGAQGLATPMVQNLLNQCRVEGQCGEGANDYLQKLGTGRLLGDSYKSKTEDINSPTPVVGSVAVWNPSGDNIGHAGIVLEDRGDKVLIRDWNYGLDEKQREHEVPKNTIAASGGGYIVPDKLKEMQIPEVQKTILAGIEDLENHPGLNNAVGFGWQKLLPGNQGEEGFLPASDAEDFRVQFMSFRDNIVLPNLELLKGAMSDNDIKFIRSAGTAASLGMSEEAFRGELNRIKNKIYEKFGMEKRSYSQDEEALIKKLVQQGATDADIDQALTLYRN